MRPGARPLEQKANELKSTFKSRKSSALLCVFLFARPESKQSEAILKNLAYLNERAGDWIDISCPGYTLIASENDRSDEPIATVDNKTWFFDVKAFTQFVEELETKSKWRYLGGVEILLINSKQKSLNANVEFDFLNAIHCKLDSMLDDGVVSTSNEFLEFLIQYCKENDNQTTAGFVKKVGGKAVRYSLWMTLLSLLPKSIAEQGKNMSHYLLRDFKNAT